jgi:hypothetical protein
MRRFIAAGMTIFAQSFTFLRQIKLAIETPSARGHDGPRNPVANFQLVAKSILPELTAQSDDFADYLMAKYQRRRLGASAAVILTLQRAAPGSSLCGSSN